MAQHNIQRCSVFWEDADDLESEILSHDARYVRAVAIVHEGQLQGIYATAWAMDRPKIQRCIELWARRKGLAIDALSTGTDIKKFIVVDKDHQISLLDD